MLIFNNKSLTVQVVRKLKLAVFTWRGFTETDIYKEGTINSLEALRGHPSVNCIILNAKNQRGILHEDIQASVKSTVDYLGIAQGKYRMAVVVPKDLLAKTAYDLYVDLLNQELKKQFVAKQFGNTKPAMLWLVKPTPCSIFRK